jgi:hypothetical protein
LSSSVRHWRGAATGGVRLRSWRDGAQFLPFAARHGLQDELDAVYHTERLERVRAYLVARTLREAENAKQLVLL